MAVSISRTADPAGASASGNVATYSAQSIGVAAEDRIVFLLVGAELASASPNSATIDYGTGAVSMTAGSLGNFGAVYSRIFYAKAPTGTTADFAVTFGANPNNTQNHVSVYRVVGASFSLTAGQSSSTDMDATAPLTTGSITIPSNGGFIATAAGATDTAAKTWVNATEDLDADAGGFRHTTATRTTSGTVTISCSGTTNGEDGAMSYVILTPGTFVNPGAGSYSLTGTAATPKLGRKVTADSGSYSLTGTAATPRYGKKIVADGGSYSLTGTAATTRHAWKIAADAGSYSLTGTAATPKQARRATADGGSYSLTGTAATFRHTWVIAGSAGSYSLAGTAATPKQARIVTASGGSYALTGTDASPKRGFVVAAGTGSYTLTGTASGTIHGWKATAEVGAYTLTGTAATLKHGWVIAAASGSYVLTGTDADLIYTPAGGYTIVAGGGSYSLTGTDATINKTTISEEQRQPGGFIPRPVRLVGKKKPKQEEPEIETEAPELPAVEPAVDFSRLLLVSRLSADMQAHLAAGLAEIKDIAVAEEIIRRVESYRKAERERLLRNEVTLVDLIARVTADREMDDADAMFILAAAT